MFTLLDCSLLLYLMIQPAFFEHFEVSFFFLLMCSMIITATISTIIFSVQILLSIVTYRRDVSLNCLLLFLTTTSMTFKLFRLEYVLLMMTLVVEHYFVEVNLFSFFLSQLAHLSSF